MSKPMPEIPKGLDPELVEKISGGGFDMCSPDEINQLIGGLRSNYDTLVDFTSYVIGRVAGEP
ncbi:hypothetical protein BWI17_07700 [Betaproteobacteria bacterium GR16-43]|nr:hypothetical protein BWI17_07700 [Betaproteobacteria bacterium GR16-43]